MAIALVAIQSVRFPLAYLRMDGSSVTQSEGGGSGVVNCQGYFPLQYPTPSIGNYEAFELIQLGELSFGQGYAIRSLTFPQAFLRMDGFGVNQFEGGGSGVVNCQYYPSGTYPQNNSSDYEHYIIGLAVLATPSHGNLYSITWGQSQNVYLRMDGSGVVPLVNPEGQGRVNCQYYATGTWPQSTEDYEVFKIIYLEPPPSGFPEP